MSDGKKAAPERRQQPRVVLHIAVRYMLEDQREYVGSLTDASESGLALLGPDRGAVGEKVVVCVDGIGRFDGHVVRHFSGGFAVELVEGSARDGGWIARMVERQRGR